MQADVDNPILVMVMKKGSSIIDQNQLTNLSIEKEFIYLKIDKLLKLKILII